ncbi:MAG TPA: signal recognition particle-docking protein FtsY [Coleofasciculaceae cyanobacterium]
MVFNWFRRQFGNSEGSPEETSSDNSQVEQEQKTSEQAEVEPAQSQSTEEQSSAVAEDYLSWAKAAYKNIQKQQLPQETASTATESAEIAQVDESAAQPAISASPEVTEAAAVPSADEAIQIDAAVQEVEDSIAPTDTAQPTDTTPTTTVEPESSATPETSPIEEAPLPVTDVSEPPVHDSTTETAQTGTQAEVEVTPVAEEPATAQLAEQTVETTAAAPEAVAEAPQPVSAQAQEEVAAPEAEVISESLAAPTLEPEAQTVAPVLEEPAAVESEALSSAAVQAEEAPAAPVPIWARQSSAERLARLERLKETAIELPEPEPVRTAVQPVESAATTVEVEDVPGLAFDEGFLWSTQVLAAQGRRPEDVSIEEISWLKRLRQGLSKTRRSLINQLKAIVGQGPLNQDAVMEIEALLLQADVGVEATDYIIGTLQQKLREEVLPPEQAIAYLKQILRDLLDRPYQETYSQTFVPEKDTLNIWLITGVNGAGKTTTIGKLAHLAQKSGYNCLIGAADTFRAAAVEQVKVWGERSGTEVIANPGKNTDPAAVVFDAIAAAQARNTELLLIDTAGRLQNKKNLMEELAKIRRIVDKKAPNAKVESLLVLDATLGQNGLRQAEVFSEAAKLSGVVLTKLDGTAKGGVALAVVQQLGLPIRFIGAGEGIEDLRPFSSYEFVEALISG